MIGAVTASTNFGQSTAPTANVILATATHDGTESDATHFIYGILAEDIADDGEGWCYTRGVVQALGGDTSAAGIGLAVGAGSELLTAVVNARVIGIALETLADATLKWVAFNGVEGFGIRGV